MTMNDTLSAEARGLLEMPPRPGPEVSEFIILADYRTGSSLLCQSLNQHTRISTIGEIFCRSWPPMVEYREQFSVADTLDPNIDADNLQRYMQHIRERHHGFKVMRRELPPEHVAWKLLAARKDLKIIDLHRPDLLAQCLSGMIQKANSKANYLQDQELPPQRTVEIEIDVLEFQFNRIRRLYRHFDEFFQGHDRLRLTYDDLCERWDESMAAVLAFIGAPHEDLPQLTQKIVKGSFRERIANYDELKAHFQETEWAPYFTE